MSPSISFTTRRALSALAAALCATALLAGCAARDAMERHAEKEDPWVESQPYPRLVDSPAPAAPGEYSAATPDPAQGKAIVEELGAAAQENAIRGAALSDPAG